MITSINGDILMREKYREDNKVRGTRGMRNECCTS